MRKFIFTLLIATFSMMAEAQVQVFYEDFENPPGNVISSGSPGWDTCTRIQSQGLNSDSSTIDAPASISYLETAPFSTQFQFFVTLTFDHICKIEFFDSGTIEYSVDGGLSWIPFVDDQGGANNNCLYLGNGLFRTQGSKFEEASYGAWQPGVIAVPDNSWWQTETFDISIVGNFPDVRLRWVIEDGNNNGGNFRNGWFVDNIEVIASDCELNPPNMYPLPPLYSQTVYNLGPYDVNAAATDASSVCGMTLYYSINGVAQTPIPMVNTIDSLYNASIPAVLADDTICYYIEGFDCSTCANTGYLPGPTPATEYCFVAQEGISFPYCDNFDITTNLWTDSTASPGTEWELGTPTFGATNSARSAPNAWDINLSSAYTNNAEAYLISPEFSFSVGAGATLEFWQNRNAEQGWDGVRLEWSPDFVTWNVLGTLQGPTCIDCENWYNDDLLNSSNLPAWTGNSAGWIKSKILLDTQFNNLPQCWFRFVFTSDGSVITDGFSIDDFCIVLPLPDDVGVVSIDQPGITAPAGNCVDVEVTVKNFGLNTQTTFPVTYIINPGGTPVTATFNGNLTPGATATFTLPCVTIPVGPFTICAYTELPGDGNNFNDTICTSSTGIPVLTLTACDDFEGGNLGYQTTSTNAAAAEWQLGTPAFAATTGAYSGTNAWDINLNNAYGANAVADLTTPIYDLVGAVNPYLSFWRNQNTAATEGLRVLYNVNGSGNWIVLGAVGDPDGFNWYNAPQLNFNEPGWGGNSNGWVESRYYLQNLITSTAATYIQFRFEFESGFNLVPNDGVSIDDLCVKQPGPDDVGVTAIFEPFSNSPAGNNSNVQVQIRNFGTATQTSIPVAYSVDGGTPVVETFNGTLDPNDVTTFNFTSTFVVPPGQFDFCAWTELPGDTDNTNDTTCISPVGIPVIPLSYTTPYFDNFDGPNIGWSTAFVGVNTTIWELGAPTFGQTNSAYSAPNAWDVNLATGYGANANCELYTPIFDLTTAVDPKLSFYRNSACEAGWDGTRLEYSVNGGPWTLLGGANLTAPCWVNWYNSNPNINSSGQPAWMGATGGWVKVEANCLGFLDNAGLVQFRFIFTSDASVQQDGFSIDDFEVSIPVPLTASPIAVNTNTINNNFIFPGQQVQFSSPISNPGTTDLTSVIVTLTIDGTPYTTDTINYNPSLPSGQNLLHTFSQLWTAAPGVYDVCVITSEPNFAADQNPFDDTTCITISVFDSVTITAGNPYCTDFESGPQWVAVNALTYNSTLNSWDIGTPAQTIINGAQSGQNAWMTDLTANYPNRDTSGLFTPVFDIDNTKCYKLSFWHKFDTEQFADGGTVEYSTDNALTWQHLGFASAQPQPWFNSPFITALGGIPGLPGWSGVQATWTLAEQEVNFFNSGPVIFRFRFATDNSTNSHEGWAIDDFCFEEIPGPCTVGINDPIGTAGLALGQNYPNPFNGVTEAEFVIPSAGHVKITVTDILGQVVAVPLDDNRGIGKHKFLIQSDKLNAGIYYYTLEFNNERITKKMIILE